MKNQNVTFAFPDTAPYLQRQITLRPRSAEEAVSLIKKAVAQNQSAQFIISPRVDKARKAYFWVGIRFDRQEVDMKLPVSKETRNYLLAYMNGEQELPEVNDCSPETITTADESAWIDGIQKQLEEMSIPPRERVEMTDNANYLRVTYKMQNGKVCIDKGLVENIFSLLGVS